VDVAIDNRPAINSFLRQPVEDLTTADEADERLLTINAAMGGAFQGTPEAQEADDSAYAEVDTTIPEGGPSAIPSLALT
jgi:hypothetical protein